MKEFELVQKVFHLDKGLESQARSHLAAPIFAPASLVGHLLETLSEITTYINLQYKTFVVPKSPGNMSSISGTSPNPNWSAVNLGLLSPVPVDRAGLNGGLSRIRRTKWPDS